MFRSETKSDFQKSLTANSCERFIVKFRISPQLSDEQIFWINAFASIIRIDTESSEIVAIAHDLLVLSRFNFTDKFSLDDEDDDWILPAIPDESEPVFKAVAQRQKQGIEKHGAAILFARHGSFKVVANSLCALDSLYTLGIRKTIPVLDSRTNIIDAIYENEKLSAEERYLLTGFVLDKLGYMEFYWELLSPHYAKLSEKLLFSCVKGAILHGKEIDNREEIFKRLATCMACPHNILSLMLTMVSRRQFTEAFQFLNACINNLGSSQECMEFESAFSRFARAINLQDLIIPVNKMIKYQILLLETIGPIHDAESKERTEKFLAVRNPSFFQAITQHAATTSSQVLIQIRKGKLAQSIKTVENKKENNAAKIVKILEKLQVPDSIQLNGKRYHAPFLPCMDFQHSALILEKYRKYEEHQQEHKESVIAPHSDSSSADAKVMPADDYIQAPGGPLVRRR